VVALAHGRGIAVIATDERLQGVITAGDLTRVVERTPDYLGLPVESVMTRTPRVVHADDFAAHALGQIERANIMAAPVLDAAERIVGVLHLHDLLRAGAG
jgi:arabinose-5-phosphate isomerase